MLKIVVRVLLIFLFGNLSSPDLYANVKLPALISDGMVLQRDIVIPVWGWASPREKVVVEFYNKTYTARTDDNGKWMVHLSPMEAGGPYVMKISGKNEIIIKNILIGEVWICSGQSNMQLPVSFVRNKYKEEIATASNAHIRMLLIDWNASFLPIDTMTSDGWKLANPNSVLKYTAVGYFFAREFYEKNKIPIGLIQTCWGGTPIQAWVSKRGLKLFPKYVDQINTFNAPEKEETIRKQALMIKNKWMYNIQKQDKAMAPPGATYATILCTPVNWKKIMMPALFLTPDSVNYSGITWIRKEIYIPDSLVGKPGKLFLGNVINQDSTYINGMLVGHSEDRYKLRQYNIPANFLKQGTNVIAVRIVSTGESAAGGMTANKSYKLLIANKVFPLNTEWQYLRTAISSPLPTLPSKQSLPSVLHNGMIAPIIPYAIRGILWYQGESNTDNPNEYSTLFTSLIKDWRKQWGQKELFFLYVQLANFGLVQKQPVESKWAELREAQAMALTLPNTGMAVAHDLGDWNDIHPLNKQKIGKRLEWIAEGKVYGNREIVYHGPMYYSQTIIGDRIIVTFLNTSSSLIAKGADALRQFAIAGSDKKFVWAKARIIDKNKVMVWSDVVKDPVAIRYAWADNPDGCNLYNAEGLPASSFRTDRFEFNLDID